MLFLQHKTQSCIFCSHLHHMYYAYFFMQSTVMFVQCFGKRMLWLTNSLLEWVLWKHAEIVLNISYRNFMVVVILILWKSYETPMKDVYENYSQWISNEKYILKFKAMKYQWKIAWKISWSAIETHVCVYIILCIYIYVCTGPYCIPVSGSGTGRAHAVNTVKMPWICWKYFLEISQPFHGSASSL